MELGLLCQAVVHSHTFKLTSRPASMAWGTARAFVHGTGESSKLFCSVRAHFVGVRS